MFALCPVARQARARYMTIMRYDIELFRQLNSEYKDKPLVPEPPTYGAATIAERGSKRVASLDKRFKLAGQRVLEIGCGRGEVCRTLAADLGCQVVGVDVREYPEWDMPAGNVRFINADLTAIAPGRLDIGEFDFVCSFSVWEHLRHPYTMLQRAKTLLRPGGSAYIMANLFRGPKASHRYRHVFFPWPHLLFTEDVFNQYFASIGEPERGVAWVNRLSIADYLNYFQIVGLAVEKVDYSITPLDEHFYERFIDVLERYPRFDLARDFIRAHLVKV